MTDLKSEAAPTTEEAPTIPYSAFTRAEKWGIMAMCSFASLFSPLTSMIYFPALPELSNDFHVSISLLNLTITVYMLAQGAAPMLWAPWADTKGRRPVYIACFIVLVVSCIGLACIPTDKWWLLIVIRTIQAVGSASTIALGGGVVADLTEPHERGAYMGVSAIGIMLGPCLGPIIGGSLAGNLGWRWIFWFQAILSGVFLIIVVLFLPETLRLTVGDGSISPPVWNRPLIPLIAPWRRPSRLSPSVVASFKVPPKTTGAKDLLRLFAQPDVVILLACNGIGYALFMTLPASIPVLFSKAYPYLNTTDIGLCFLPIGLASIASSVVSGKVADWIYRTDKEAWKASRSSREFNIERTRLKVVAVYVPVMAGFTIAYGWVVDRKVFIAAPLIFEAGVAWPIVGLMNTYQTLLIDLFPKQGSSTVAAGNLIRCWLGAGIISALNPILEGIGAGWTFVLLGALCGVSIPLLSVIELRYANAWKAKRAAAEAARQEETTKIEGEENEKP